MYTDMVVLNGIAVLCLGVVMSVALPVEELPVLKQVPDVITFKTSDPNSLLTLSCAVEDAKNIKYTWKKNGVTFDWSSRSDVTQKPDEGTLVFRKPKKEDVGQYQCYAESKYGVATAKPVTVKRTFITTPSVTPTKHRPINGRPYNLDCPLPESYPEPEIEWVLQSLHDPSVSKKILNIYYHITKSADGTLWFANVTERDVQRDMKYVCQALTPAADGPVTLAEHYIEGLVENKEVNDGKLVPQYLSEDMKALLGQVTMMYCIYGGTPLAYPGWRKNGRTIKDTEKDRVTKYNGTGGKRLLIRDTRLEDEANYTCFADNDVDQVQEHTVRLTVVSVPVFDKTPQRKLIAKEGEKIKIDCQILGKPAPEATWTYNTKPFAPTNRVSINHFTTGNRSVADLTIDKVQKNDTGYYGCKGKNENGEVYAETLLFVS